MTDDTETQHSHLAWIRVELPDATPEEARWFFETLAAEPFEVTLGELVAEVVRVVPDETDEERRARARARSESKRYTGD